ncbi:hypothetical protein LTR17_001190 [Elasticomyces elasticus]|nr:hypothetical protein LTR17_001190 [Elasticomyces elasticus]
MKHKASEADDQATPSKVRRPAADAPKRGKRTIAVLVGTGAAEETFDVYSDLLVSHSDFFKAALKQEWKEGQERSVALPEDCPEEFEIFYHFVNEGLIFSSKDSDRGADGKRDAEWSRLTKCWMLGQKLLSTTFKDAILDAITAKLQLGRHPTSLYQGPYRDSSPSAAFKKLLTDIVVYLWKDEEIDRRDGLLLYPEFLFDIAKALSKVKVKGHPVSPPWNIDGNECYYHEHVADGTPCYKTLF